jgi:hypothetical protein
MKSPAWNLQSNYKALKKESYVDFDLFKLDFHETMKKVFYFKGEGVREIFDVLVNECCKLNKCSKKKLSSIIATELNCNSSTIDYFIYYKNYLLVYLTKLLILKLSVKQQKYFFMAFNKNVNQIKFGLSKNWIKFPRHLSKELVWLCGAIAADGWISIDNTSKERLGIVDQNKRTILKAKDFFKKIFYYSPRFFKDKKKDCFWLIVDSKAISKFFTIFMGYQYGVKTYSVSEPVIIKQSKFRLDFASGVLSFDGSVKLGGTVALGLKSKSLVKDVFEILNQNGLFVKYSQESNGSYSIRSASLLNVKNIVDWIELFDENLEKGYRLKCLVFGFEEVVKTEEEALERFKKFIKYPRRNKCPFEKIFLLIKNNKKILKEKLLYESGVTHATLYEYLWLLRKANIVTCKIGYFGRGYKNEYVFNSKISSWRVPMLC